MNIPKKLSQLVGKYKYVILILLLGVGLMLLPTGKSSTSRQDPTEPTVPIKQSLAQELEQILSQLQGAGKVRVLLSTHRGERILYQTDSNSTSGENQSGVQVETVLVSAGSGHQSGLVVHVEEPVYRGAIILCSGGENPQLKLEITNAVARITGLSTDKITVLKLKD